MSAVRVPILALGALQGRDAPAHHRLRAIRRPSRPHSGPLRAFHVPGYTPGHPLKHPSTPVPRAAGSAPTTTPTPACPVGSVRSPSNPDVLGRRAAAPRGLAQPASAPPVAFEGCSHRSGSVSAAGAPILALGAFQGRDAPANHRLRAVRRPSRLHSGPLRAFHVPGYTPGHPLKHPSTPVPSTAISAWTATSPAHRSKPGAPSTILRQAPHHPGHIVTHPRSANSAPRGPLTDRVLQVQRSLSRRARPQQLPVHQNGTTPSARIVTITEHTEELQRLRAFQRTEQFKKRYRRRVVVEHRIGRLVQLGIRQARYLGRVKVAYQVTLAAAVANLVLATSKGSDRFARVLHSLDTAVRLVTRCRIADLARIVDQPLDSRSIPLALLSRRGRPQLAPSRPVF